MDLSAHYRLIEIGGGTVWPQHVGLLLKLTFGFFHVGYLGVPAQISFFCQVV